MRRRRSTYLITSFFLASWTAPQAAGYSAALAASIDDTVLAKQVDVGGGRMLYLYCSGPARPGRPTVIFISGYHDSSDPWTQPDVLSLLPQATGPSVLPGLARTDRVCAYDRPGTMRYIDRLPLTIVAPLSRNRVRSRNWHQRRRKSSQPAANITFSCLNPIS